MIQCQRNNAIKYPKVIKVNKRNWKSIRIVDNVTILSVTIINIRVPLMYYIKLHLVFSGTIAARKHKP